MGDVGGFARLFEARAHAGKNRLYIVLRGCVTDEEARTLVRRVREELPRLRPGADVLTDVTQLEPLTDASMTHIREAMALVKAVSHRWVRVVGKAKHVAVQMERLSKDVGCSAHLAFSVAEAERLLDGDFL